MGIKPPNVENLRKLQRLLRTKKVQEHFNLGIWANDRFAERLEDGKPLRPDCGAAACALGWAVTLFPNRLYLEHNGYAQQVCLRRTNKEGEDAAAVVFGIPAETAVLFTSPYHYQSRGSATPQDVIDRIDRIIAFRRKRGRWPVDDDEHIICWSDEKL